MASLKNFLHDGSIVFKEVVSPINGLLTVKWDITFGYQIMGGGLWQVGGPVRTIWKYALDHLKKRKEVKRALILGLGGGSIAKIIRDNWNESSVVGVDVDKVIVDLGIDYLGLDKLNVDIVIGDAFDYLHKEKKTYDLICVDTYVGDSFPKQFESEGFLHDVSKHLEDDGVAIFNRLYYSDKRKIADHFEKELSHYFARVEPLYPELSALYLCSKSHVGMTK
ncbi:hypothetical protein KBA63_03205, partial [Candidatus Woesebacteria bacterium]|nr:hypothetical protein [Candidatus Woesebacteria bacterium]MBP9687688.1 hypothetical protein [Candidatus Woesebacteria bacterium]